MPERAKRSLIFFSIAVFLAGMCVVLARLSGQTQVGRGGLLVGFFLSSSINGLTDIALGGYLYRYYRAVRDRGENKRLWWTLGPLFILGGLARVLGSGTPFLPSPAAIVMIVLAVGVLLVRAGFAVWNFPDLRRDLEDEGKRPTRAEQQAIIDDLKGAKAALAPAPVPHDHDLIRDARVLIDSALARANALFADMEARATQE